MHDVVMSQLLGGALSDVERVSVDWPAEARPYTGADDLTLGASIDVGITNLSAQIDAALARLSRDEDGHVINGERVTVVGLSAWSLVVTEVLRLAAADLDAPDQREINFVVAADSSRQEIIADTDNYNPVYDYTYRPAPETVYDTIVVTGEYDGFADFPDRWWNLTAVANAMAGSIFVHVPTMFADLTEVPEENVTVEVNSKRQHHSLSDPGREAASGPAVPEPRTSRGRAEGLDRQGVHPQRPGSLLVAQHRRHRSGGGRRHRRDAGRGDHAGRGDCHLR